MKPQFWMIHALLMPCLGIGLTLHGGERPAGADVPFSTHEAETMETIRGQVIRMPPTPGPKEITPEVEASGRAYVELRRSGDYLEFRADRPANTLTLRHCIPDAPGGGGSTGTLSLYVNGRFVEKLSLSSKFNWLYGPAGQNGQSNDPTAGSAHVFWEEATVMLTVPIAAGDMIRLQRDGDDAAAYHRIDLVDLEEAPPPLPPPPEDTFLSVLDFGANGGDELDDTAAVQRCIDAALTQNKIVWIPAGTYRQSARWQVTGVRIQGAGMWHTNIVGTKMGNTWGGQLGFIILGDGSIVRDLSVTSAVTTSRALGGGNAFTGNGSHWLVENVWISHTHTGFWMSGATHGVIRRCRVRFTYADGINLNNGATDNLVEHCHVRGTGDDSLAILSETRVTAVSQRNTLRRNTAIAPWWGHNCDLAGGNGHIIEDNLFADSGQFGGMVINLPSSYPMHALSSSELRRNRIVRCGGNYSGQRRGAVWIFANSAAATSVVFTDNEIVDPIFNAIHLHAPWSARFITPPRVELEFRRNRLVRPSNPPIVIERGLTGSVLLEGNTIIGPSIPVLPFGKKSNELAIFERDNSWQR